MVLKELRAGLVLGSLLGALAVIPVAVFFDGRLAAVVSLTLVAVCAWACVAGSLLPVLVRRLGFDPAVVSAPFIKTMVDATGLLVYFLIAHAVFDL